MDPTPTTRDLLDRVHRGDPDGLHDLLERHLPWIRERVHHRLGPVLRRKAETEDLVQNAAMEVLRYGPKFAVDDDDQFRALLGRIVENVICDQHDWMHAERRHAARERPLAAGSVIELDPAARSSLAPTRMAERNERESWVRLAIELLEPEDRRLILMRQMKGLSYEAMGAELGVDWNAARMRFQRALGRLGRSMVNLKREGARAFF